MMSPNNTGKPQSGPEPQAPRRKGHPVLLGLAIVLGLLMIVVGLGLWYSTTPQFEQRVRAKLISTIEDATGGKVDLGSFNFSLRHLEFEVRDLTVHGLEAANEVPYLHVDRLLVRAKIISLVRSEIGLNLLHAEHPVVHLILYPDGTTNQPTPKTKSKSNKSVTDTLFDLAVDRTELINGLIIVNQRKTPFDLQGRDLELTVTYAMLRKHYLATAGISDFSFKMGKQPEVHARVDAQLDLARNAATLSSFTFKTGQSALQASGSLNDFSHLTIQVKADGNVDLHEAAAVAGSDAVRRGLAELHLTAKGDLDKFNVDGTTKLHDVDFATPVVRVFGVNAATSLHVTERDITLPDLYATLEDGGTINGSLRYTDYRQPAQALQPGHSITPAPPVTLSQRAAAERAKILSKLRHEKSRVPKAAPAGQPPNPAQPRPKPHGVLQATIRGISLREILRATAPKQYQDLGFDTMSTGKVEAEWYDTPESAIVKAQVALTPTAKQPRGEFPVSGNVEALYEGRTSRVLISHVDAHTPATNIVVTGVLGVAKGDAQTDLQADLGTTNLGEFDRLFHVLGLGAGGKTGAAAIPVRLEGTANFHGTVSGRPQELDVKGHVDAQNFDTVFAVATTPPPLPPPAAAPKKAGGITKESAALDTSGAPAASTTGASTSVSKIHWDSLHADAEYSPTGLTIGSATLVRGPAVVQAAGKVKPYRTSKGAYKYDERAAIEGTASIKNAQIADLEPLAGMQPEITGILNGNIHAAGTVNNLNGGGHLSLTGGAAYNEPYKSLNADVRFAGSEINVSQLTLLQNGGRAQGTGAYDHRAETFRFDLTGNGFELSHFRRLQSNGKFALSGDLIFSAHGQGSVKQPQLSAHVQVDKPAIGGQAIGRVQADLHTQEDMLYLTSRSSVFNAPLAIDGHAQLKDDYPSQMHVSFTHLNIEPAVAAYGNPNVKATSDMSGTIDLSGPLKLPKQLRGEAVLTPLTASVSGIDLASQGQIHATLVDGVVKLDPLRITGRDTELRANGTFGVFGRDDVNLHAEGGINLALAQSFNSEIVTSGNADFNVDATGTLKKPDLVGQIKFVNANMAVLDFPNGLSQMNGTLVFNRDRLEVQSLTAQTGGGKLSLAGYLTYRQDIYADLTVKGTDIRVRYPQGVSSIASAELHLQGAQSNLVLSGDILITRFALNSSLDLAAFAGQPGGITAPPDPKSLMNHVRLDIHVTSAPQLDFRNSYARLAGDVDLRIRGTAANPAVLGRITITEGNATFAGVQYQLQRGDIYFSNPVRIDPVIDLDAAARIRDYDIVIGLHGPVGKLNLTYRSEPPLPQADVVALLALGRTQEEAQIYQEQQAAAGANTTTNAILGGALNATVSNRVQRLFGVGSVKIDPTFVGALGNSTARITVEQKIGKNLTVTYATNVNSTAQQLIGGQIDVTHNTSLVIQRDESDVFSTVIKFRKQKR
jgi:translocation and assembly module TamB